MHHVINSWLHLPLLYVSWFVTSPPVIRTAFQSDLRSVSNRCACPFFFKWDCRAGRWMGGGGDVGHVSLTVAQSRGWLVALIHVQ